MCRLIGIVKKAEIPNDVLYDFISLASKGRVPTSRSERGHKDGWGFAGFRQGRPYYMARSPINVLNDPHVDTCIGIACHAETPFLFGHIRKSSRTPPALQNTHPFMRNGWLFCHNGTVFNQEKLTSRKYPPEGETDSEAIFLFLLERIRNKKGRAALPALRMGLEELRKFARFSSLNFLLSDGRVLYAFREYNPKCREGGYRSATELKSYYTLFYAIEPCGTIICSEPLNAPRRWISFNNRELRVYTV